MQTLWWLPNKILRHIHKKRFSVFLSRFLRICNQSVQKVLVRAKKNFVSKNSIWVSKNDFLPIWLQSLQKVLIWPQKNFLGKKSKKISKTQNFTLILKIRWKSFEKMNQKKVIIKNVTEICTFFTFTHVRQTCFACNFFLVHFLTTFSTDSKSAWNSAFLIFFFYFFPQKFFWGHISTFCKLWSQMRRKRLKKSKNVFCKCALHLNFATIKGSVFFIF